MKKSISQMMILLIIFLLLPLAVVSAETSLYDGIEVTTLPHNFSGLVVKGIEFGTGNKVTLTVENQTVYAVSSMSNIAYICYNQSGENVKSGLVFLEAVNQNETCRVSFDKDSGTKKIIFSSGNVYPDLAMPEQAMSTYDGIEVTTIPCRLSDIYISNIRFGSNNKAYLTVKNETGVPIKNISNIAYKCYNQSNEVIKSGLVFLEALKNNETCEVSFDLENGTAKIAFYNPTIYSQTGEAYNKQCNHNYILVNGRYACSLCGEVMENNPHRLILTLPDGIRSIEEEAFEGVACEVVIVPSSCTSIGSRAFSNCKNLKNVRVPVGISIAPDAFEGCGNVVIDWISE